MLCSGSSLGPEPSFGFAGPRPSTLRDVLRWGAREEPSLGCEGSYGYQRPCVGGVHIATSHCNASTGMHAPRARGRGCRKPLRCGGAWTRSWCLLGRFHPCDTFLLRLNVVALLVSCCALRCCYSSCGFYPGLPGSEGATPRKPWDSPGAQLRPRVASTVV